MSESPNKMKHTPGPWRTVEIFRDNAPNIIGIFGPRSTTSGFNGVPLFLVEKEVDARLVAAAPSLLEALEQLLADKYLADPINADRMAKARAAVAKAKAEGGPNV